MQRSSQSAQTGNYWVKQAGRFMASCFFWIARPDPNPFSALLGEDNAPREIFRLCLSKPIQPLMGNALFSEFESLMLRAKPFKNLPITVEDRQDFLNDLLNVCNWVDIYFLWRPNLRDEADNHLIEQAMAGNASHIITGNRKDFESVELLFPQIKIVSPRQFLTERSN